MTQSISSASSFAANRASRLSSPQPELSLDLSGLPPLSQPSPPSNTLLITDLNNLSLFQPESISAIKARIIAVAPLNSFSPLPSLRRIVCSFHSTDAAIRIRQLLDGEAILGRNVRARVYFGEHTLVENLEEGRKRNLLEAPHSQKLFFISPPPSPPHGWTMRNEDPPNKEVHPTDLAEALNRLGTIGSGEVSSLASGGSDPDSPVSLSDACMQGTVQEDMRTNTWPTCSSRQRSRSSTIIYNPEDHGNSPDLPAVMVEDTTESGGTFDSEMDISPIEETEKGILARTARPPVELMD